MSDDNAPLSRFRFQRMLEMLENKEGRGTELISVYISPGKQISEAMSDLRSEWGTAGNIKSKTTKKNVQDALTRVMERLKLFKKIPENGLVIFAGRIAGEQLGVGEMETYVIVPPEPISTYYYRCDQGFVLHPLSELLKDEAAYGLLMMDSKDATFALLKGRRFDIVREITSGVPGKHRAGGQSSRRFERIREMQLNEYFNRIGKYMTEIFLETPHLKGIIVGGPGPMKEDFVKGNYLHYELKDKVLTVVDTGYTGIEGVKEVVERSRDFLKSVRFYEERKVVQDFLRQIGHDTGLATYGEKEVIQALKSVNIVTLLLSEGVRRALFKMRCRGCGADETRIIDLNEVEVFEENLGEIRCPNCGNEVYEVIEKEDLIEALVKMAEEANADIEMISTQTEEGEMILKSFGGIAAILKYRQFH